MKITRKFGLCLAMFGATAPFVLTGCSGGSSNNNGGGGGNGSLSFQASFSDLSNTNVDSSDFDANAGQGVIVNNSGIYTISITAIEAEISGNSASTRQFTFQVTKNGEFEAGDSFDFGAQNTTAISNYSENDGTEPAGWPAVDGTFTIDSIDGDSVSFSVEDVRYEEGDTNDTEAEGDFTVDGDGEFDLD